MIGVSGVVGIFIIIGIGALISMGVFAMESVILALRDFLGGLF